MSAMTARVWMRHPDAGNIYLPQWLARTISLPGRPTRKAADGEFGLLVGAIRRPVYDEWTGKLLRYKLLDILLGHNSRQNIGAAGQANQVFGTSGTTPNGVWTVMALASASITVSATGADKSLGSTTTGVTTNEYTASGLARVAGTVGTYTAPTADGGQFSQALTHTWTCSSGPQTVYGGGIFDSTTVASSNMYAEGLFGASATLQTNDQLAGTFTPSN